MGDAPSKVPTRQGVPKEEKKKTAATGSSTGPNSAAAADDWLGISTTCGDASSSAAAADVKESTGGCDGWFVHGYKLGDIFRMVDYKLSIERNVIQETATNKFFRILDITAERLKAVELQKEIVSQVQAFSGHSLMLVRPTHRHVGVAKDLLFSDPKVHEWSFKSPGSNTVLPLGYGISSDFDCHSPTFAWAEIHPFPSSLTDKSP